MTFDLCWLCGIGTRPTSHNGQQHARVLKNKTIADAYTLSYIAEALLKTHF